MAGVSTDFCLRLIKATRIFYGSAADRKGPAPNTWMEALEASVLLISVIGNTKPNFQVAIPGRNDVPFVPCVSSGQAPEQITQQEMEVGPEKELWVNMGSYMD